jgi:hypothetical protein
MRPLRVVWHIGAMRGIARGGWVVRRSGVGEGVRLECPVDIVADGHCGDGREDASGANWPSATHGTRHGGRGQRQWARCDQYAPAQQFLLRKIWYEKSSPVTGKDLPAPQIIVVRP